MKLAKQCDVVLENMSEGATARLGVDYDECPAQQSEDHLCVNQGAGRAERLSRA